jgi:membrane fusion protein (multidrug efflux system)
VDSVANATGSRLSLLPPENAIGNYVKIVQRIPVKVILDPEALSSGTLGIGANVDVTVHAR